MKKFFGMPKHPDVLFAGLGALAAEAYFLTPIISAEYVLVIGAVTALATYLGMNKD